MSGEPDGFRARASRLLSRRGVRYPLAAAALLAAAVALQRPAARLNAESRLESSLFRGESDAQRIFLERQTGSLFLPERRSLHYFWLGNDGLAASSVWIKSAGYVAREFGYRYRGRKFEWLDKLYNTVVDLDPHWQGACKLGATLLSAVGKDPGGALALLEKGMRANPDSWRLCYEAGLLCLIAPGRAADAAKYFRMATLRPGCPEIVEELVPRVMAEAGRTDLAIYHARALAERFRGEAMGASMVATLRELVSRQGERLLARAVARFRDAKGALPRDLADLRLAGMLAEFDLSWAEGRFVFEDAHARLVATSTAGQALHRERVPGAPGGADVGEAVAEAVRSGFLNEAVLRGDFAPPEAVDAMGRPFRYHAPTGALRSEGVARIDALRTLAVLRAASGKFRSVRSRFASSLDETAEFFGEWIREGRPLEQSWHVVFKDGRAPVHPLAPWGERYVYDPGTGRVDASWPDVAPAR